MALVVKIGAEMRDFDRQMRKLTRDVRTIGNKFKDAGKTLTAAITLPIVGLGAASIKTGMEFESSMSKVAALSGATGDELEALEKQARELGATTIFSASQAAEGMAFLAMAGYDTNQILASMPGLLDLAAAGQLELGRAADITTNIMSGFGIKAEKTGQVADVLAKAASSANTSVEQMGDAMSYVAPVAAGAGLSLEETAAAISILSNAGIQGQRAGTSLRRVIASLQNPTGETAKVLNELGLSADDVNPSMHSLTDILKTLEEAGLDSSQAMRLVGTEAGPALLAMMSQGSEGLAEFTNQLENSEGAAAEMAAVMQDNLAGRIQEMKSAFEEVALTIYDNLKPALETIVTALTSVANWFNNLSPSAQNLIMAIAAIAAAIGPLLIVIGSLIIFMGQLKAAFTLLGGGVLATVGPVLAVIGVLTALAALFIYLWNTSETFREGVITVFNTIKEIITQVVQAVVEFVMEIWGQLVAWWQEHGEMIKEAAMNVWNFISNIIMTVMEIIWNIMQVLWPIIQALIVSTWEAIKGVIQGAIDVITGIIQFFAALFTGDWSALWESVKQIVSGAVQLVWNLINLWFVGKILKLGKALFNGLRGIVTNIWNTIKNLFNTGVNAARNVVNTGFNFIRNIVNTVMNGVRSVISNIWNGIKNTVSNIVNGIRNTISNIFNSLRGIVSNAFGGVRNAVSNGIRGALNVVTNIAKSFFNAGKNIVTSIANGIRSAISSVTSAIGSVTSAIRSFLPFSPAKKGALRDIMDVQIVESIAEAINKSKNKAIQAMDNLTSAISNEMFVLDDAGTMLVQHSGGTLANIASIGSGNTLSSATSNAARGDIVFNIDGYEIARIQKPYLDDMFGTDVDLTSYMRGERM